MNQDQAAQQSKLNYLRERMRTKYPDEDMDDDDAFYGKIGEDFDSYEQELQTHRSQAQALSDMFASNPRSANLLQDLRKGEDLVVSIVRLLGEDNLREALEDPDKVEQLAEANREYLSRIAQNRELEAQYEQNMTQSLSEIESLQTSEGLSDDDIDDALRLLNEIASDYIVGRIKPESVLMALKALRHDEDVASAREEGAVEGRNTRIIEKLRKPNSGDGVAHLGGGASATVPPQVPHRKSVFLRAKEAK